MPDDSGSFHGTVRRIGRGLASRLRRSPSAHVPTRRRPAPRPVAVVAACYDFPIYSHGFVYEEMLRLREMDFDVRLFCWRLADPSRLHRAFHDLWGCLHVLETRWDLHVRDYRYFRRRNPRRVDAVMARLSRSFGQPVETLERDYQVMMAFSFARAVEAVGADYIHTYFFYEQTFFGLVASYLLDVPRGVSCYADHMLDDSRYKDFALQFERLDVAVATSRRIAGELRCLAGDRHAGKILVKPNGVDGRRFAMRPRRQRMDGQLELLSISRIEEKKGLIHLCDVARGLRDAGREARIHVVGSVDPIAGGCAEYARAFADRRQALGVDDMFVMHGFLRHRQMPPLFALADVFVAPYVETARGDKDGIPTAMLEAMASGIPIVSTDAGSIGEVIDEGVEGLLVPQVTPAAMTAALLRLCDEPGLGRKLGIAAHRRFAREFDASVTEPELHDRLRTIVRPRPVLRVSGHHRPVTLAGQTQE